MSNLLLFARSLFDMVLEQVENFKRYRRYEESELDVPFQSAADGE